LIHAARALLREVNIQGSGQERILLALAGVFVALNRVTLALVRGEPVGSLWPLAVWAACAIGAHLALERLAPQRDPYIVPIVLLLTGWGLTLIARVAPPYAARQSAWMVVSTGLMVAVNALPANLRSLRRYRYTWLLLGLSLVGATLVLGVNPSGDPYAPRLWLGLGGLYFQPSEPLKLLLIVYLASYLAERREMIVSGWRLGRWRVPPLPYVGPMLLMWGFCMLLLVWQRDLGAATLFFAVFLAMLYVSTGEAGYVLFGMGLLLGVAAIGYALFDVVRLRVDAWWNPWLEADSRAFQIVQSLIAVAAGGLAGQGVGQGAPTYVPVVHSDFAFAAIAEEWGLLGSAGVIACMAVLTLRAMHVAFGHTHAPFMLLLSAGIGTLLSVQSLLIMGGVLKIVPLTGVTLPFISYGGSSLASSYIMVGLLLRMSDSAHAMAALQARPKPRP
jgi:cell division protein FtsW (lipid II flippase)